MIMPELFYCDNCKRYEDAPLVTQIIVNSDGTFDEELACNECEGPLVRVTTTTTEQAKEGAE